MSTVISIINQPFHYTYVPNTDDNIYYWTIQYNYLRNKGIKLKNNPQTEEEKLLRKLYGRLNYAKSRSNN